MVIFSREVLKDHPGATIISEVKSSQRLYQDIEKNGGKGIMWKTGHSLIKSKMKETKAHLAGEMSGHIFFADRWFGFDDAIYASLRLYEIVAKRGALHTLTADLPAAHNTPEIRIDCEEEKKFRLIEEAAKLLHDPEAHLTTIDGLRVDYADRWGLIRASNTQPVIVMRFEARTEALLNGIQKRFEAALQEAARICGHGEFGTGH
jgi:phosphomannomutase/phosphoglucomutase